MNKFHLLELMDFVRTTSLPADWNAQRLRGERSRAFSRSWFDDQLFKSRPEIETSSFLKTIYIYQKHNEDEKMERELDPVKVQSFLQFIFHDIATPHGWPAVVEAFKTKFDGAFSSMVSGYEANFNEGYKISRQQREQAGATEGEDEMTQLLQLAIKAKERMALMNNQLMEQTEQSKKLKEALAIREEQANIQRERIAALEALLSTKGGDQSKLREEIERIKQNIG